MESGNKNEEGGVAALGVYSRTTVPRPVNTGDSHSCNRPTAVPDRPVPSQRAWALQSVERAERQTGR